MDNKKNISKSKLKKALFYFINITDSEHQKNYQAYIKLKKNDSSNKDKLKSAKALVVKMNSKYVECLNKFTKQIIKSILEKDIKNKEFLEKGKISIQTDVDSLQDSTQFALLQNLNELTNEESAEQKIVDMDDKKDIKLNIRGIIKDIFESMKNNKITKIEKAAVIQIENAIYELLQKFALMSYQIVKDKKNKTFNEKIFTQTYETCYLMGNCLVMDKKEAEQQQIIKDKLNKYQEKICK